MRQPSETANRPPNAGMRQPPQSESYLKLYLLVVYGAEGSISIAEWVLRVADVEEDVTRTFNQ